MKESMVSGIIDVCYPPQNNASQMPNKEKCYQTCKMKPKVQDEQA